MAHTPRPVFGQPPLPGMEAKVPAAPTTPVPTRPWYLTPGAWAAQQARAARAKTRAELKASAPERAARAAQTSAEAGRTQTGLLGFALGLGAALGRAQEQVLVERDQEVARRTRAEIAEARRGERDDIVETHSRLNGAPTAQGDLPRDPWTRFG